MTTPTITEQAHNKVDTLAADEVDSTDSEVRYMAYASRLRTALRASTRYVAYVSTPCHPLLAARVYDDADLVFRPAT